MVDILKILSENNFWAAITYILSWIIYELLLLKPLFFKHTLEYKTRSIQNNWIKATIKRENAVSDAINFAYSIYGAKILMSICAALIGLSGTIILNISNVTNWLHRNNIDTNEILLTFNIFIIILIFSFAMFSLGWSLRHFGYVALLFNAVAPLELASKEQIKSSCRRIQIIQNNGISHYIRTIRAFYFALGFLPSFINLKYTLYSLPVIFTLLFIQDEIKSNYIKLNKHRFRI